MAAMGALLLIGWKATSTGSNVMIQRGVTENVRRRVVITKVKERAPRRQAA